jgi:Mg/Co/Ni transporter MgtE
MPANLTDSSDRLITRWVRGEPGELAPENRGLLEELEDLIRDNEQQRVVGVVGHWHPIDLAELLLYLPIKLARRLFSWLPSGAAVNVLVEVSTDLRALLLEDIEVGQIAEIAAGLEEDDAVELLDDLPEPIAADVLERLRACGSLHVSNGHRHVAGH